MWFIIWMTWTAWHDNKLNIGTSFGITQGTTTDRTSYQRPRHLLTGDDRTYPIRDTICIFIQSRVLVGINDRQGWCYEGLYQNQTEYSGHCRSNDIIWISQPNCNEHLLIKHRQSEHENQIWIWRTIWWSYTILLWSIRKERDTILRNRSPSSEWDWRCTCCSISRIDQNILTLLFTERLEIQFQLEIIVIYNYKSEKNSWLQNISSLYTQTFRSNTSQHQIKCIYKRSFSNLIISFLNVNKIGRLFVTIHKI